MPIWIMAGVWGFVAGLALLLGAAAGYFNFPGLIIVVGFLVAFVLTKLTEQ